MSSESMNSTTWTYPYPLASYEDVVANKDLFMSTLTTFHSEMGIKFWIPKVRFGDLDLHKLFVEVTSRGGIEQIVREDKWKDVLDTFNFPKSQRNPIFSKQLRRDYYSLLQDYEIIYFFRARDQIPPLTGLVNEKIKSSYPVTFTMGSWKLEGVMYESTEERVTQDPEEQSNDVSTNTLTDKANPQELFETKNIQWNQANKQEQKEVVVDVVPLKQGSLKQNTEANAPMEESKDQEVYSSGYNSDFNLERRSNRDKIAAHMEKAGDLMNTSLDVPPTDEFSDEIFENSYSVTVTIGSETLRGALFQMTIDKAASKIRQ